MIKITFAKTEPKEKATARVSFTDSDRSETLVLADGRKEIRIGLGAAKDRTRRKLIIAARKNISLTKIGRIKKLAVAAETWQSLGGTDVKDHFRLLAENLEMANFEFVRYKTPPKEGWAFVEELVLWGNIEPEVKEGIREGQTVGDEVNKCRELANTPGGEMTPKKLAAAARETVKNLPVGVSVLDPAEMAKLKMGGILGVAKGSKEAPQLIVLEYKNDTGNPTVLVGKGVTFDTGGLNIKTGDYMYEMHMDMSGGAAVIHAVAAAAKLGLKRHVIGIIPAVENMPSGESYRPGDILRSMSGKTIEIINTDAEGRVILADAITYAKKFNPKFVIDVATLTGAAVAALGEKASAIFSRDKMLLEAAEKAGEASGDYVWPLPLWDEYEEEVKGTFGDVANASKSRYGGAINGAMFLYQFAKDLNCPWLHIDMAPRMTATEGEQLAKGAAGAPLRLLVRLLESAR